MQIKMQDNEIDKCSMGKWAAVTAVITVFSRLSGIEMEARWKSPTAEMEVAQRGCDTYIQSTTSPDSLASV